jgi:hypothetical protein
MSRKGIGLPIGLERTNLHRQRTYLGRLMPACLIIMSTTTNRDERRG